MLFKDFFFSFKNIHASYLEKKDLYKLLKIGISILYKFFILELIVYNFFYKQNLDKVSIKKKELFNKDLNFLFSHFNSLRQLHNYSDFFHEKACKPRKYSGKHCKSVEITKNSSKS